MKRREFVKFLGVTPGAFVGSGKLASAQERLFANLLRQQTPADQWVIHQTTCTECPAGCGLLVRGREGRPIKLEGDPDHPVSQGGLCMRGQASLGRLYHPERIREPLARSGSNWEPITWDEAIQRVSTALADSGGTRNLYLSGRTTGTLARLIDQFAANQRVEVLPEFEIFNYGALREAYDVLYGRREIPAYHIDDADLLITIGADLFENFLNPVRFAHRFAAGRDGHQDWHHIEPQLTMTGANSDHRLAIRPGSEHWLLAYLFKNIQHRTRIPSSVLDAVPDVTIGDAVQRTTIPAEQIEGFVEAWDAAEHPLAIAGGVATAHDGGLAVAMLAGLLQESSGSVGSTVDFGGAENYDRVGTAAQLARRASELSDEEIGVCFLSRLHTLAAVPGLQELADGAQLTVGLTDMRLPPFENCDLLLPTSHSLESWGDAEATRGLTSVLRPAFSPLFDSRTEGDVLLQLMGESVGWERYLQNAWRRIGADFESAPTSRQQVTGTRAILQRGPTASRFAEAWYEGTVEQPSLIVSPSMRFFDGRGEAVSLLHEIPDPLTAVSYGNALCMSAEDAEMQDVEEGDGVVVGGVGGFAVRIHPAYDFAALTVGAEHLADLQLPIDERTGEIHRVVGGIELSRERPQQILTILSGSMDAHGRGILPNDLHHPPGVEVHEPGHEVERLYPTPEHETYRWAMAIDLDKCTGCSACVAACYVENNITIAGPEEHRKGREMSWIRIEPFLEGDRPIEFLPVMCQQCSNAPCETVCPVYATYHNPEGLNAQIYNRCVGTRYCANNCPYKARRFNWFAGERPEPMDLLVNPDVSIRPKGVMEKCTFCIQRIREGKDHAKDEDRLVRDGEFTTACAQSCPSGAIVFGNLLDHNSEVYRLAHSDGMHRILEQLGTEPAVYYIRSGDGGGSAHE